ncbi:FTSH4 [Symbiodinium microadriaticum]|nr:FTSH4 [Symbiodinium microadriaticum]
MRMTLNQLLVEMDGFQTNSGTVVIAATNFPESLDNALTRPGRLDKHVDVSLPDVGGRKAILELYGSKVPLGKDVDLEQIARGTPGFSGAELSNLINQAALKASIEGRKTIDMHALEYAKDKIMMGAERQSAVISPETAKMTAFHEAGHALISLLTDGADPIHKATIMPRGRALGMVMQLPDGDQVSMSRKQMLAKLDICMGGRVAEELIFGEDNVTSGASSDFQQATRLARAMVTKWGFSSKLGVQSIDDKDTHYSGETQTIIDSEVRQLLSDSYTRAKTLLETNRKQLTRIAEALIEHETLSGAEVAEVAKGMPINTRQRSQKASRESKALPLPKKPSPPRSGGGPVDISSRPATVSSSLKTPPNGTGAHAESVVNNAEQNHSVGAVSAPHAAASSAKKPTTAVRGPPTASTATADSSGNK